MTTRSPCVCNERDGACEGLLEGRPVGVEESSTVGEFEGESEGNRLGMTEGKSDGCAETVGLNVSVVGADEMVGINEYTVVGDADGRTVTGDSVVTMFPVLGAPDGIQIGSGVGLPVGK